MNNLEVKLTKSDGTIATYKNAYIDSIESKTQCTTDNASVQYGVLANSGSITLKDLDGQIRQNIESEVLPISNMETNINVNGNQIQSHLTTDSNYVEEDKTLNLTLSNRLSLLDNMTYNGMTFSETPTTAYEILADIFKSLNGSNYVTYGDNYFTLQSDNTIKIEGDSSLIETTLTSNATIPYTIGHKYYVSFQAKASTNGYTAELFFPVADYNKIDGSVTTSWTKIDGIIQRTNATTGQQSFRLDNNNTNSSVIMYYKDIIIYDMTANNVADMDINWCRKNIYTYYKIDNMYLKNAYSVEKTPIDKLKQISIPYPYVKQCSYREAFNKICQLAQLQLILDEDDELCFIDTRTIVDSANAPYVITPTYQKDLLNRTILLKNKYDAIDMKETNVVAKTTIGETIGSVSPTLNPQTIVSGSNYAQNQHTILPSGYMYLPIYISIDANKTKNTLTIPIKSNNNMKRIIELLDGVDTDGKSNIKYSVKYTKYTGTATAYPNALDGTTDPEPTSITKNYTSQSSGEGEIPKSFTVTNDLYGLVTDEMTYTSAMTLNTNTVKWQQVGDNFVISDIEFPIYAEIVGLKCRFEVYQGTTTQTDAQKWQGTCEKYEPISITISYKGTQIEFSLEDADVSTSNISKAKTPVSIEHNELLQSGATWDGVKLSTQIKNNILEDYNKGVQTGTIDLFVGDMSRTISGTTYTKQWKQGELLNVGETIKFLNDDKVWKVTGRTFKFDGFPYVSLELQKQKMWHTIWTGSISVGTLATSSGLPDTTGYYFASTQTNVSYTTSNDSKLFRIYGTGTDNSVAGGGEDFIITAKDLYTSTTRYKTIYKTSAEATATEALQYGNLVARLTDNNQIEFINEGYSSSASTRTLLKVQFTITKIEQLY